MLLQLSEDLIAKHEELFTPLDSALHYSKQAKYLSDLLNFRTGQIRSYYTLGSLTHLNILGESGREDILNGIKLSKRYRFHALEAKGWYYLGNTYPRNNNGLVHKIRFYQHSSKAFKLAKCYREEAYIIKTIADMHHLQGNVDLAANELLQVLAIYKAIGYNKLHSTYDLLAAVNEKTGDYRKALHYGLAAVENAVATRDTADIGALYWRLGLLYMELHQLDQALEFYKKSFISCEQNNYPREAVYMARQMSIILVLQKKPKIALSSFTTNTRKYIKNDSLNIDYMFGMAENYLANKQYGLAEKYFLKLLDLAKSRTLNNNYNKLDIYHQIGKFYLSQKKYSQATMYLSNALALSKSTGTLLDQAAIHHQLFKIDSARQELPAALAHYQQYKLLNDAIFNEAKAKQISSLQIQYDTKKKEQSIALLTKQAQVQQERLRKRELQRNAVLGGSLLLLLLLGVSYRGYRQKRRSTALLEQQQQEINQKNASLEQVLGEKDELLAEKEELLVEKEWMLKEIHHRVKNNLQVISSLLSSQAYTLHEPATTAALRESQNRVQTMGLLHQKLYQSDSLTCVRMHEYLPEIVRHLIDSFDRQDTVQAAIDVEPMELDVALATPLGLIINEAVTNALKYAFPDQRDGTLTVQLQRLPDGRCELHVADDGVGLPAGFDWRRSRSLGLSMIRGLSKQIDGQLSLSSTSGVHLGLQFEASKKPGSTAPVPATDDYLGAGE